MAVVKSEMRTWQKNLTKHNEKVVAAFEQNKMHT